VRQTRSAPPITPRSPIALLGNRRRHPAPLSQQRNEARRFNILIDTLYEARTLLIASAEVPPEQLYTAGDGTFEFRRTASYCRRRHLRVPAHSLAPDREAERGGTSLTVRGGKIMV
jgi:hypothetical protein